MSKETERKFLLREDNSVYITGDFNRFYPLENPLPFNLRVDERYAPLIQLQHAIRSRGVLVKQGYLDLNIGFEIARRLGLEINFNPTEARLRKKNGIYSFTLKDDSEEGSKETRNELERKIEEGLFLRFWPETLGKRIKKARLTLPYPNTGYEVEFDLYLDRPDLLIAEIETPTTEEAKNLIALGLDVTGIDKYKNRNLAKWNIV